MKLLMSIVFMVCASSSWGISIVGDDAYPPYSFKHKGQASGIYTDIIQQALRVMNDASNPTTMPWKRGLSGLESKAIDALFPPYYRPKQRPYMSYSTAILDETLVIVCNAKISSELNAFPEDYHGISLGQNAGFSSGAKIDNAVKAKIIKLYEAKGMSANLKKLINNRIDCYVNDRISILYELKKMAASGEYDGKSIVETHILGIEKGYLSIHKDANEQTKAFIEAFNKVINEMKASGSIDEIIAKYTQ